MPTLKFNKSFIKLCEEYSKNKPRLAQDPREFLIRAGRLAIYKLERDLKDRPKLSLEDALERVPMHIPQREAEEVKKFLEKYGLFRTVSSFYYFSALMILLGIWELPPKI